jgi:hypothetical protein
MGAQAIANHNPEILTKYLDISYISYKFGMRNLELWARTQFELVLQSSYTSTFVFSQWNSATLLHFQLYADSTGDSNLRLRVKTFIQYLISIFADKMTQPSSSVFSNFNACVEMYKDGCLKQQNPVLFGCVFAAIVSQDHRSGMWTSAITQKDKMLLYAAQVQLTSVAQELEKARWLLLSPSDLPFFAQLCPTCQSELPEVWKNTFGSCGHLNSSVLLQDMHCLSQLPQYLHRLRHGWKKINCSGHRTSTTTSRNPNHIRPTSGPSLGRFVLNLRLNRCLEICTPQICELIDGIYGELASRHAQFAS